MKLKLKLIILITIFSGSLFGQQILNGDMENWDTINYPSNPTSWLTNANYVSLPCSPALITAEKTSQSNSGEWAAKLEAKYCVDDIGQDQVYIGFLAYGDMNNPNLAHGIPYNQKPGQLNFYYKFNRVGTDTGFAKIVLRLLDSTGHAGSIVGEGKVSLINDTNIYTLQTVPINYVLTDTPQIIQIVFSTSKTVADHEYFPLNTSPGNGANIGTTLWIDDVTVSGGTLGITEYQVINTCSVFPNPMNNAATITFNNSKNENFTLKIYDGQGQLVKMMCNITTNQIIVERTNLTNGFYFFQLASDKLPISTGKFIIK